MTSQCSNPPFPKAAIDIGTNSVKLLIGRVTQGKLTRILKMRTQTRLGRSLIKEGIINEDGLIKSIRTLKQFQQLIEDYNADSIIAVGTSALRDAGNSFEFIEAVKEQTGIDLIVISGDKEAELTVKGVLWYQDSPPTPAFITDIGGGSTEWTIHGGNLDGNRSSIQIGAVRLFEQYIFTDPPSHHELLNMINHIIESVKQSFLTTGIISGLGVDTIKSFVVSGGTAVTVAMLEMGLDIYDSDKIHLHKVTYAKLNELYKQLSSMSLYDRADVKGLEPERADIIIPGIAILLVLMEMLNIDTLTVSDYGLLEGLLCDII
ncbi:MAG: Ppx/GppA family phosphatase [Nitrospirae bacterium]|nr:Ppx/GppA family phosphatase [Nitrospirota bacterium]